jgi:hypothetical protein
MRSRSVIVSFRAGQFTPPFAPPNGMPPGDGGLPGHELRERAHVVEVDVGVEP